MYLSHQISTRAIKTTTKTHEDEISNIVSQLWTAGQQRTQLKSEVLVKIELYVCVPETRLPSVPREVPSIKR